MRTTLVVVDDDALFLRETTAIDHHTYRLARTAEREGLIVIDDPQSILRCCNKIYNHASNGKTSGGFDTLPTFEAPQKVIRAAVKAAGVVGDGLYGVDIKEKGGQVFVIEVNDNPSIERGAEDQYLGNELYQLVMSEFARRLEQRGRR